MTLDEDDQTKAIVVNRTLIFAYMGWSKIERQKTNEWFATVIKRFADADELHEGMREVARRATAFFKTQPYPPEEKRHAFIGVGWQRRKHDGRIVPMAVRITNTYDNQDQLLPRARSDFVVQQLVLGFPISSEKLCNMFHNFSDDIGKPITPPWRRHQNA